MNWLVVSIFQWLPPVERARFRLQKVQAQASDTLVEIGQARAADKFGTDQTDLAVSSGC